MDQEREPGRTFAPDDIGWLDFETKSQEDIKAGTYRYMSQADAIIAAFALGNGPPRYQPVKDFSNPLSWDRMPSDFRAFHDRVMAGAAKWCAWNAPFDRAAWNYGTVGFPFLEPEHIIDAMTQATVNGLPPSLKMAAKFAGATAKIEEGTDLIKLFCHPESTATPQSHPEEWRRFGAYALGDIVAMREIFQVTRQMPLAEWKEYWSMERVNARGVAIDLDMVKHATWLAHEDKRRSSKLLSALTDSRVSTVDQVAAMSKWLLEKLPPEGRDILLKREEELDDDGKLVRPAKFSLTRGQVERLIAYVQAEFAQAESVLKVLQIRLYGGSKSPAKFAKMQAQHVDGVLYGQYVFAGAPQTGRASSKGVQVHNLTRSALAYEHDAIEAILGKCSYDALADLGDDSPVARKLALLIRPSFIPAVDSSVFVWSDWKNIEARIVPWLCDYIPGAAARLQMFRDIDADPRLPDLYTRTAADLSLVAIGDVSKEMRQRGKVAELALGFLGGVGSLLSMGASLGVHFTDTEAKIIVDNWRAANPWAMQFGNDLWAAMLEAKDNPNEFFEVGRVGFVFIEGLLGGSMLMRLPSGRFLTYRRMHWDMVAVKDDDDNVIGHQREMTSRGFGRVKLWKGELVNNATQGTAADILRGTLVRLEADGFKIRLQTHDEVIGEVNEQNATAYAEALHWQMCRGFDWTEGLPIVSEETISPYYTKAIDK